MEMLELKISPLDNYMLRISIILLVLFTFSIPSAMQAHSMFRDEKNVGGYRIEMTYFGDAVFSDENTRFTLLAYLPPNPDMLDITDGTARITNEDGVELFSGSVQPEEDVSMGEFMFNFPEEGNYSLIYNLETEDGNVPEVVFPLYVYDNPNNQIPLTPILAPATNSATTSNTPAGNNFLGLLGLVGFLGLLALGYLYISRRTGK